MSDAMARLLPMTFRLKSAAATVVIALAFGCSADAQASSADSAATVPADPPLSLSFGSMFHRLGGVAVDEATPLDAAAVPNDLNAGPSRLTMKRLRARACVGELKDRGGRVHRLYCDRLNS